MVPGGDALEYRESPEDDLKDEIALVLLALYPEGAAPDLRRATYSGLFPGKSSSTYDRYHRKSRQRLEERGFVAVDENVTPAGLAFLARTTPHFVVPQAITRLRELQERIWDLEESSMEMMDEKSQLESDLATANRLIVTIETQIAQMSQPRADAKDVPEIPPSIRDELQSEVERAARCIEAGLHNQGVATCGKILEIVLHERYEDLRGRPLPKKESLGHIIKRFKEERIDIGPDAMFTLTYINQMRNISMHKQRKAVTLAANQALAILGLTLVVIERLFSGTKSAMS